MAELVGLSLDGAGRDGPPRVELCLRGARAAVEACRRLEAGERRARTCGDPVRAERALALRLRLADQGLRVALRGEEGGSAPAELLLREGELHLALIDSPLSADVHGPPARRALTRYRQLCPEDAAGEAALDQLTRCSGQPAR